MEEGDIGGIPVENDGGDNTLPVAGTPITYADVQKRLSDKLYRQLSDGETAFVTEAIRRAEIYVMAIMGRFRLEYSLDDPTMREITLINTVAELHIALGNIEGAKELRLKAKDIVLAAYGDYPDTEAAGEPEGMQAGAVVRPHGGSFRGY